jgi:PTS system nitrogen regulatory IIA component
MCASAETTSDGLLDFLQPDCVVTLPSHANKDKILAFMVEVLASMDRLPAFLVPSMTAGLIRRERLGTTGLGSGLALPHLRSKDVTEFAGLVGIAADGIDFGSIDGCPARVVILVISPFNQTERHLEILGRLAKLFSDQTLQYSAQVPRSPRLLLRLLGINTNETGVH